MKVWLFWSIQILSRQQGCFPKRRFRPIPGDNFWVRIVTEVKVGCLDVLNSPHQTQMVLVFSCIWLKFNQMILLKIWKQEEEIFRGYHKSVQPLLLLHQLVLHITRCLLLKYLVSLPWILQETEMMELHLRSLGMRISWPLLLWDWGEWELLRIYQRSWSQVDIYLWVEIGAEVNLLRDNSGKKNQWKVVDGIRQGWEEVDK